MKAWKTKIELLEMKNVMCELKNVLDGINNRVDTVEEKISKLEDIEMETIKNKTEGKKKILKMNRESASTDLTYMQL